MVCAVVREPEVGECDADVLWSTGSASTRPIMETRLKHGLKVAA